MSIFIAGDRVLIASHDHFINRRGVIVGEPVFMADGSIRYRVSVDGYSETGGTLPFEAHELKPERVRGWRKMPGSSGKFSGIDGILMGGGAHGRYAYSVRGDKLQTVYGVDRIRPLMRRKAGGRGV